MIAGGVESMSRAPFVVGKSDAAFSRSMKMEDTTMGWRFVNPLMKANMAPIPCRKPPKSWPKNIKFRAADQDAFALRSQQRAAAAMQNGNLARGNCRRARAAEKRPAHKFFRQTSIRARTALSKDSQIEGRG